jgi:hypothetical protein
MTNEEYKKWQKGATKKEFTSAKGRGYDRDWRRIREAVLLRDSYLCQVNGSENCTKDTPRLLRGVSHLSSRDRSRMLECLILAGANGEGRTPMAFRPPDPKSGASASSATFARRTCFRLRITIQT